MRPAKPHKKEVIYSRPVAIRRRFDPNGGRGRAEEERLCFFSEVYNYGETHTNHERSEEKGGGGGTLG